MLQEGLIGRQAGDERLQLGGAFSAMSSSIHLGGWAATVGRDSGVSPSAESSPIKGEEIALVREVGSRDGRSAGGWISCFD